jgi:thiol:disulfide interchange protein
MRGQVLETTAAGGLILGEDGQRYKFMGTDWKSAGGGTAGAEVDFVAVGERATQVYALRGASGLQGRPGGTRGWEVAARPGSGGNSVLLGWLGIACLVLAFMVPVLPVIGAFVFGLAGVSSAKRDGNAAGLTLSRVAWIGAVAMTAIGAVLLIWFAAYAWPFFEVMWEIFVGIAQDSARRGTQV